MTASGIPEQMINSMTGFARKEATGEWGVLTWEIRSVNHRYLELFFRLPEEARPLEGKLREIIKTHTSRGKLECTLRLDKGHRAGAPFRLNDDLLAHVIGQSHVIARQLENPRPVSPLEVLRWPGVTEEIQSDSASMHAATVRLLDEVMISLNAARCREGERMAEMIRQRSAAMSKHISGVRKRLPEVREKLHKKLLERFGQLDVSADEARLEQELVLLLQKMDVDEELDRLDSHVEELAAVLLRDEPVGRRLDFLLQEFNREANTLASKSQDTETTRTAVEMKVLIEQIREQVQNIE